MNDIIYYILGALCVSNLIVIWKVTNISVYFYKILFFYKKNDLIYTADDLENYLAIHGGKIGELFICPLCLATHLSWITGLVIYLLSNCSPLLILAGTFSWPLFSYLFLGVCKKFG